MRNLPGDNFAIAASLFDDYRNEIRVNTTAGENLRNDANQAIPISGEGNPNNVRGLRTRMLTVWRRLNIEIDSMSAVTNNNVTGGFPSPRTVATGVSTLTLTPSAALEPNRFENGRLEVVTTSATHSFSVVDHTPTTTANTANSITISNPGPPLTVSTSDTFRVYDDDDFDGDDATTLNGDDGDNVTNPDLGSLANTSDSPADNALLRAYVRPVHVAATIDTTDDAVFRLNTLSDSASDIQPLFVFGRNIPTSTDTDDLFWAAYLLGSYQHTLANDNDPNEGELATRGIVDEITGSRGKAAAL